MLQGLRYDNLSHTALALILAATCIPLCFPPHSAGVLLSISLTGNLLRVTSSATSMLGGSYVEESPAPITVQWSSGQDLCFRCRGSPSGKGSHPGRGRSWSDPKNPPKYNDITVTFKLRQTFSILYFFSLKRRFSRRKCNVFAS